MSKKTPTQSQQKAIDIDINAVVSAGAGSGKTSVLSQRFVHLVTDKKYKVEEILTLTFTKKATVEMYGRIYKALKEKAPENVADFYKASIKTLDSYCASIAKQGSRFYGISPDFTQDEDAIRERAENMALPFILQHRDNPAIKALVKTKDFSKIAQELFVNPIIENSTVAEPIDFDHYNERQKKEIISAWKKEAPKAFDTLHSLDSALENFEGNKNSKFIANLSQALSAERPELPVLTDEIIESSDSSALEEFIKILQLVASLKLTTPKGCDEIKELINFLREKVSILISLANFVYGYYIIKEITPLLKEFQEQILHVKRSSGILSFADVSSLAKCILRDHPEIRQLEKQKYKAIMIDEFQDNNMMQRDLLFMLAEKPERMEKGIPSVQELCPDKLFFVGDEKQSIYRFRGADVSVFRGLSKDFQKGNLELEENFRSEKNLVLAFNTIFGGFSYPDNAEQNQPSVFFKDTDNQSDIPEYEAVYHKVSTNKKGTDSTLSATSPLIHIALFDKSKNEDYDSQQCEEAEALWVAKKIKQLLKTYKASDIAILFRTYNLQPLYERILMQEGIPYNCEVTTGFFNDGPSNDIFAMLRLCAYKTDSLSYSTVLRSPFVNLSIEETNAVMAKFFEEEQSEPFATEVHDLLSPASATRYYHAKRIFQNLCEKAKTESLTKLVTYLWYDAGYRYETAWNMTVTMYASIYDKIFELARQSEEQTMSLASFVDSVRTYQDESEKLNNMDIPLEQEDGIHILTIHKSKGLEFPVVFVCGTHKQLPNDSNASPVYSSKEFGLSINTPPCPSFADSNVNYFYNKAQNLNKAMAYAELKRLTYVAFTRPEKELYVTGVYDGTFKECNAPKTILQTLSNVMVFYSDEEFAKEKPFTLEEIPAVDTEQSNEIATAHLRLNTKEEKEKLIHTAKTLYENAKIVHADIPESIYILPSSLEKRPDSIAVPDSPAPYKEIDEIVLSSNEKFGFNDFGTVAHFYMEQFFNNTKNPFPAKYLTALENKKEKIETVERICSQMAKTFINSELGKEAINSTWKKTEYNFRSREKDKIVKGTMDLVFKNQSADGYTIVDYKTDSVITPETYTEQLKCYAQAISKMLNCPLQNIKCYLYYLRHGKAVYLNIG